MAWYEILLRLGLALVIGFCIGLERERHHRPAGIKTHILVCLGATVISLIQVETIDYVAQRIAENPSLADVVKVDVGRMGAQVISGIGFLGAGTIIVRRSSVKGLTSAATLWLVACLGIATGMGFYEISVISFALAIIVLLVLRFLQTKSANKKDFIISISMNDKKSAMDAIESYCLAQQVNIKNISFDEDSAIYTFNLNRGMSPHGFIEDLMHEKGIEKISEINEQKWPE